MAPSPMLRAATTATSTTTTTEPDVPARPQVEFVVPNLTTKDLLSAIPAHCFERSALRSFSYLAWDIVLLALILRGTLTLEARLPALTGLDGLRLEAARTALWTLYAFVAGLVATGVWVLAHECGHQAFSPSKTLNNTVGWVLHSALGVPYHSWRITHAKHHASTGHVTLDQVFVPKTRSEMRLPAFDPANEDLRGARVTDKVKAELWEALGDSPLGATLGAATYLLLGWPLYLTFNVSGPTMNPRTASHFTPSPPLFAPHQRQQVLISAFGVLLWLCALAGWASSRGAWEVGRVYLAPWLWVNHWLVLITFLQHTDPLLPHYRSGAHTFARGALCTFDRALLGDLGAWAGWVGAVATHGISETHVLHHVASKIPHYHAWAAADALRARLKAAGIELQGRPGGWREVYRVYRECKFIEDEGAVVFYKNAKGEAAANGVFADACVSDSGVDGL